MSRYLSTVGMLALISCFLSLHVSAQLLRITSDTATPVPNTGKDYLKMGSEIVNPADGSLSIRINVPMPKGRGLTIPFSFAYDSNSTFYAMGFPILHYSTYGDLPTPTTPPTVDYMYEFLTYATQEHFLSSGGWLYTAPLLSNSILHEYVEFETDNATEPIAMEDCTYKTGYIYSDPGGGRHDLHLTYFPAQVEPVSPEPNGGPTDVSKCMPDDHPNTPFGGDLSVSAELAPGNPLNTTLVSDSDGTIYHFPTLSETQHGLYGGAWVGLPDYIEDRNGNRISIINEKNGAFTYRDTLGRTVLSSSGFGHNGDTVSVSGLASPYVVNWQSINSTGFQTNFQTVGVNSTAAEYCLGFGTATTPGVNHGVSSIQLPNGQAYSFGYDGTFGLVNQITYPGGGWVKYKWEAQSLSDYINYDYVVPNNHYIKSSDNPNPGGSPACRANYDKFAIVERDVSFTGGATDLTQTFTYATTYDSNGFWTQKTTKITTKDLDSNTSWTTTYTYVPGLNNMPIETNVVTVQDGKTLETVSKSWYLELSPDQDSPFIACNQVLRDGTFSSLTTYAYAQATSEISQLNEYASGSCTQASRNPNPNLDGTLLRTTNTTYADFTQSPLFPPFSFNDKVFSVNTIVDLPSSVVVKDGSGNKISETDFSYDETAVAAMPGIVGHDDDCYGLSVTSACGGANLRDITIPAATTAPRGNITTVSKKCFANGVACPDAVTTYTYDQTGQVISMTPPCGNSNCTDMAQTAQAISYSYSDPQNTNAYLTKITYPSVNGVQLSKSFTYDYTSGVLTGATDENKQLTTYCYFTGGCKGSSIDPLHRVTEIDYPDGGQVNYTYNDGTYASETSPSVTTLSLICSPTGSLSAICPSEEWKKSIAFLDGMGHIVETRLTDVAGTDIVKTAYDGVGNVRTVTNPYQTTTEPTYGTTEMTYDALGRKITQVAQDTTSTQGWSYQGNLVIYTDENGNQWQRSYDNLGRLIQVLEPNSLSPVPSMETDYTYDGLNNLTLVQQWGGSKSSPGMRQRSFTYDSLSRLLTAANPETGMVTYSYDRNGNVWTKTDARGILINYTYDALNRILSKTYSNDSAHTPSSCYQYDSSSATNGQGRLTSTWTQSYKLVNCKSASSFWTMRSLQYDAMGRVTGDQQCTPSNCVNGIAKAYTISYLYNQGGNLASYTGGTNQIGSVGSLNIQNTYDVAGRLNTVSSNWIGDSGHPATLFSAQAGTNTNCWSWPGGYSPAGSLVNAQLGSGIAINRNYDKRLRTTCENNWGSVTAPTPGAATITITGTEQTKEVQ